MDRTRKKLFASAGFPAQQHGRVGFRDDADLVEHRLDRLAFADDARHVHPLARRLGDIEFPLETPALFHQAFPVPGNRLVQLHGLPDEIGNHGQETHVVIEAERPRLGHRPVDRQRADHPPLDLDRNPHEGRRRHGVGRGRCGDCGAREQGMLGHVLDHERHGCRYDLIERLPLQFRRRRVFDILSSEGAHQHFWHAVVVEQHDRGLPKIEIGRENVQDVRQRRFEPRRPGEDLCNLVNPVEGNFGESARMRAPPLGLFGNLLFLAHRMPPPGGKTQPNSIEMIEYVCRC